MTPTSDFPFPPDPPSGSLFTNLDTHETNCVVTPCSSEEPSHAPESCCRDLPDDFPYSMPSDPPAALAGGTCLRHRSWWHDRLRISRALHSVFRLSLRPSRFDGCGSGAFVQVSATDPPEYRITADTCRDRWCRPCQRERSRIIAANLVDALPGHTVRFLTLTIKTDQLTLVQAVNKLYQSFAKLRATTWWQTLVNGGAAICEIKRTKDATRWHPHLHCLITGCYLEKHVLRRHWWQITGDSYIVDIRRCEDGPSAARYITKYLSKPVPSVIVRNHDWLLQAIVALHGRRLVTTFGDWRGLRLTHVESEKSWETLCSYRDLVDRAAAGSIEALKILRSLLGQHGLDPLQTVTWLQERLALHRSDQAELTF